jgi:hypothetical protein
MDLGGSSRVVGSGRRGIVENEAFEETGNSIIEERISGGRKEVMLEIVSQVSRYVTLAPASCSVSMEKPTLVSFRPFTHLFRFSR